MSFVLKLYDKDGVTFHKVTEAEIIANSGFTVFDTFVNGSTRNLADQRLQGFFVAKLQKNSMQILLNLHNEIKQTIFRRLCQSSLANHQFTDEFMETLMPWSDQAQEACERGVI